MNLAKSLKEYSERVWIGTPVVDGGPLSLRLNKILLDSLHDLVSEWYQKVADETNDPKRHLDLLQELVEMKELVQRVESGESAFGLINL